MQLFDRSVESPANVKYYTSVKTNEQILVNRNENLSFSIYSLHILGDSQDTANIYCKSHNLPNTDTEN